MAERGPFVTAAVVASTLLLLRDDPELDRLLQRDALPPLELAVREAVPALGQLLDHVPWPLLRRAAFGVERLLSPGFIAHYALRKSAIRSELVRAVEEGFEQVVLVGAGFDMLSVSVPSHARVYEVDHPATQQIKRRALEGARTREVICVPADLTTVDLAAALLGAPGFDPAADTVFVAEGLLMYLTADRVDSVLGDMASGNTSRRTRAVVSVMTPDERGHYRLHTQRRVVDLCMRWLDEPFVWGERREAVDRLLARHGLSARRVVSTLELRDQLLARSADRRLPRATGEIIVVADRSRQDSSPRARPTRRDDRRVVPFASTEPLT